MIVTVRCGTSSTSWRSLCSRRVRYTCATHALLPRWQSLAIESRIMWCAFFSRQSRYSNATHALMNAGQSFWIMKVYQSPAFSIIFIIFPCVTRSLTVIAKVWQGLKVIIFYLRGGGPLDLPLLDTPLLVTYGGGGVFIMSLNWASVSPHPNLPMTTQHNKMLGLV